MIKEDKSCPICKRNHRSESESLKCFHVQSSVTKSLFDLSVKEVKKKEEEIVWGEPISEMDYYQIFEDDRIYQSDWIDDSYRIFEVFNVFTKEKYQIRTDKGDPDCVRENAIEELQKLMS